MVGGTLPEWMERAATTASMPPAAPSVCPVTPFVEETTSPPSLPLSACSPNTLLMAIVSKRSL
jgi:hypothetical protein